MRRGNSQRLFSSRGEWVQSAQAELLLVAAIGGYLAFLPFRTWPDLSTLCLLLFGLVSINSSLAQRPRLKRADYFVISVVVFAALCSAVFSEDPARGIRFLVYVCLNMFLLVLASTAVKRRTLRLVAVCVALFGVLHLLVIMVSSHVLGDASARWVIDSARMATLIVPNDALVLGLCLPSLAFALEEGRIRRRARMLNVLLPYFAISVYASYLLQSKIVLLSVATATLVYFAAPMLTIRSDWRRIYRVWILLAAIVALLLIGVAGWYLGNQSTTRLSLWAEASFAHSSLLSVLFGVGPNTFLFNPFSAEWGFDHGNFIVPWVHNLYLEAYYEQGLFGLLAVVLLTFLPLWRALRIPDRGIRSLMLATMVTFSLVAIFEVTLTRRFYFAVLVVFYGLSAAQTCEVSDE